MIIGGDKHEVVMNIRHAIENKAPYKSVETEDPVIDRAVVRKMADDQIQFMRTRRFHFMNHAVRGVMSLIELIFSHSTTIEGLDKIKGMGGGVLVAPNHFNPLENLAVRKTLKKAGWKRPFVVSQALNLGMTGWVGMIFKYFDTIPIIKDHEFLSTTFPDALNRVFQGGDAVIIYPEEQMWFNYRRPRPGRHGVYDYAAALGVPIISLYTEAIDTGKPERSTKEFDKTHYVVHVLDTLYPDMSLPQAERSKALREADDAQKKAFFEEHFHMPIDAPFEVADIVGWHPERREDQEERKSGSPADASPVDGSETGASSANRVEANGSETDGPQAEKAPAEEAPKDAE